MTNIMLTVDSVRNGYNHTTSDTDQHVTSTTVAVVVDGQKWLPEVVPTAPLVDGDRNIAVPEVEGCPAFGWTLGPARAAVPTIRHHLVHVAFRHVVVANQPTGAVLGVVHVNCGQTSCKIVIIVIVQE